MTQLAPNAADAVGSDQQRVVKEAVAEISHIATLPEITLKIIQLVEDPDATAQDLNKIITNDPALGARILKVVNSAFYGLPGQIGSLNRAIVLLGLNAVKNIAIAASLAKLFRGGQICPGFNARDLWTHSVAVATGTRLLADKAGLGLPDEAFLGGLIHDLGIMILMQVRRAKFAEIIAKSQAEPQTPLRQIEQTVLGATHEQFGAGLCQAWKFPQSFSYVTGYHHHPMELAPQHRTLTTVVYVADVLASNLKLGFSRSVESAQVPADWLEQVRLTPQKLQEVASTLPEGMAEAQALLADVG